MGRICNEVLLRKVAVPRAMAAHIKNNMTTGFSSFTIIGYPKVLPVELARCIEEDGESGITAITGGNVGDQLNGVLVYSGVMEWWYDFRGSRDLRVLTNADRVQCVDTHVSHGSYLTKNGYLRKIDAAVIEAAIIQADSSLVFPFSVGIDDTLVKYANKLILEVNEVIPLEVEGMHDILTPERVPHIQAAEIFKPDSWVGPPYLACDPDKVATVILTSCEDTNQGPPVPIPDTEVIVGHIVKFLQGEVVAGRLSNPLPSMQSSVDGVADAVPSALAHSELEYLSVHTGVMQDAVVGLIDVDKVVYASGTALTISPPARGRSRAHIGDHKGKIILRPQELSSAPETIRHPSTIAMNTVIEVDLAGNVDPVHIGEGAVMNGIGGSGDHARNSGITIFSTASTARDDAISCIVFHVAHVDHTEHDTEIIITEQGLADLWGLTAYRRVHILVKSYTHPKFRPGLREYVEQTYAQNRAKHGIIHF